LLNYSYIINQ